MVPLQKNIEKIRQILNVINPTKFDITSFKNTGYFKTLLEYCLQTNEIVGINFEEYEHKIYCVPMVHSDVFDKTTSGALWGIDMNRIIQTSRHVDSMMFTHRQYWEIQDLRDLEKLETMQNPEQMLFQAFLVAKRILNRSPEKLAIVCGPISTGPKGVEENLKIFNRTVYKLGQQMPLFNQLTFERLFGKAHELLHLPQHRHFLVGKSSSRFFIDHFYLLLFALNKEWNPHFIYGWEESDGANDEYRIFRAKNSPIVLLDEGFDEL